MDYSDLIKAKSGIKLDIGCGANKQDGFIGMDIQPLPGVDIVHDWFNIPWPLPDECAIMAVASHVLEHIPRTAIVDGKTRWPFIEFMDEVWRVMKPGYEFLIAVPYCLSPGYYQDPTHVNPINERVWFYFDPESANGELYAFYKPKPWKIKQIYWDPTTNLEVVLSKREVLA